MARKFNDIAKDALNDPERRARIEKHKDAILDAQRLAEIRKERKVTQEALATVMGTTQENVSRIERADNIYLSTLTEYLGAIGGRLEINVIFDDDVIPLALLDEKRPKASAK